MRQPPPPEFASQADHFKVRFGGEPKVIHKGEGVAKATIYALESANGALTVTVRDLPIPENDPPDRALLYLAQVRDDMIRAAHATAIADKSTTLAGKYNGRSFTARFTGAKPGLLRVEIYLAGKRLYQVMAIGTEEFADSPAASAFLDSFMVTE